MTIRVPPQIQALGDEQLAALLTRAVLNPRQDENRAMARSQRMGASWVHWTDSQKRTKKARHPLD